MKNKIKAKWRDILIRAGKTALQSFLVALPVDATFIESGKSAWIAALTAAGAAGISAGMNVLIVALSDDYL